MKKSVGLVGIYPPPIGGISVHVKRLQRFLIEQGVDCVVYAIGAQETKSKRVIPVSRGFWLLGRLIFTKEKIIHHHEHAWHQRAMLLLLKLVAKRIVFTFHSFRDEVETFSFFDRLLIRTVAIYGDHFIATGPHIRDKLIVIGVRPDKISVIPAFLPPQVVKQDFDNIPTYVWSFIDSHKPIILANAFRIAFYQGQDLYGIDMCIDLCATLRHSYPDIGLVFCLPQIGDEAYFAKLQDRINQLGIADNFMFVNEEIELYPILKRSDLFVRPTNTDSFGVSVAEALSLGVPAIASNVCYRAEGSILFQNRNQADFLDKVRQALVRPPKITNSLDNTTYHYAESILRVYANL